MNEFNDFYFTLVSPEGESIEFSIRELLDYEFSHDISIQRYTKQVKIEVMKDLISDIEKCISIIEKDENARLNEVWEATPLPPHARRLPPDFAEDAVGFRLSAGGERGVFFCGKGWKKGRNVVILRQEKSIL